MRKTIAAIFASLVLVSTATQAQADENLPPCSENGAAQVPCVPEQPCPTENGIEVCPISAAEFFHYRDLAVALRQQVTTQQEKIARQAKVIKRLRHRLATR